MVNKRKREELSDSDSDEVTPGKQILPVANLPYDFDQEPEDGMQYLFLVRRDARRLPHVTRVRNPYDVPETSVVRTPSAANILPREGWRIAFETHFSNLRKNLSEAVICNYPGANRQVLPEKKDRDAWWKFLAGHPASAWSRSVQKRPVETVISAEHQGSNDRRSATCLDAQVDTCVLNSFDLPQSAEGSNVPSTIDLSTLPEQPLPPEITPRHLREIDHRMSMHLLMYFTHWINVRLQNPTGPVTTISTGHGQWIFALLVRVEDQLSADEMNLLRNLARACLGLIRAQRGKQAHDDAPPEGAISNTTPMSDASCWMIFTAIAGYWGQRDLWIDAETALGGT